MSDIDALAVAVSGALAEMTTAVIAVREAVEGQARIYVELEDIREGMATIDARLSTVERESYQAQVRDLHSRRVDG